MADESVHGSQHQAGVFDQASSTNSHLDNACPPDELALYEGLGQLGMRSEQSEEQAPANGQSPQHTNLGDVEVNPSSRNKLIDVEHDISAAADQAHSPSQSEERDEFGLPPQRPTPSRMASSPDNGPATELDMYAAELSRGNPWAEEHNARGESPQAITQDRNPESVPGETVNSEIELDAYEAMQTPINEPLRRDGAGAATPRPESHSSNSRRRTSTEAGAIEPPPITYPEAGEEQSPPRRNNSIVLPRWQPDAEVTYCPICSTQFSWFNRKHHCRKCGRVVCATCSQHRITIPHEFIVHPPQDASPSNRRPSLSQRDTGAASATCGGTKVRLCNPCVPDPNTLPPPPIRSPERERHPDRPTYLLSGFGQDQYRITEEALNAFEAMGNEQSSPSRRRTRATSYYQSPPVVNRAPFSESRFPQRTSNQHTRNTSYTGPHYDSPPQSSPQSHSQSYGAPPPYMPSNTSHPISQPRQAHYNSGPLNPSTALHPGQQHVQSMLDPTAPPPSGPRRGVIPEQDSCWVCLADLREVADAERRRRVEAGTAGDWSDEEAQKVRERHVKECVIQGEYIRQGRGRREQTTSHTSTMASEAAAGPSSPLVRPPRRYYELFPFIATEKDCIDDAECSMCLEEFEVGAKMARLECFCRFHEECIRAWWEKKPGMCPVHGRDMEGL